MGAHSTSVNLFSFPEPSNLIPVFLIPESQEPARLYFAGFDFLAGSAFFSGLGAGAGAEELSPPPPEDEAAGAGVELDEAAVAAVLSCLAPLL